MLRNVLFSFLILIGCASVVAAQVPERRLVMERDVDYLGTDIRSIFDTTLEACERACLGDQACVAFTFNTRSNACFPKTIVTDRAPYDGALSAVVMRTDARVLQQVAARRGDLSFLSEQDIEQAVKFAQSMGRRHPGGAWSVQDLEQGAAQARNGGNALDALRWIGPAVQMTDQAGHWALYAADAGDHAQTLKPRSKEQGDYRNRALLASVNSYLRAITVAERGRALELIARALEPLGRGSDMVPALRLARELTPSPRIESAYATALGKYGFRVVNHRVESDLAVPRICAEFSEPLDPTVDYTPYVQLLGQVFATEADGQQLCIDGVRHGDRVTVILRAGLPQKQGEGLAKDVSIVAYVQDRSPAVRFPGRAYVLPKTPDAALPIVTVNLAEVDLVLRRISDRNLVRVIQESYFGRPLAHYEQDYFDSAVAEEIWRGTGEVQQSLNEDVTTRLPMSEPIKGQPAGIYALSASIRGADPYEFPAATQWFVISDIGLATMAGTDGLHVMARALGSAEPMAGITLTLLSRSNRELGEAVTDAQGHAVFPAGLSRGRGGTAPAVVMAQNGAEDVAFLSLTDPAFDLSDRGVEGRAPAGPVDLFVTTDRGAYRAGETIFATALARDGKAQALDGVPLTAVLTRPDGVEYARRLSTDPVAGGHVFALPVGGTAPRGTYTLRLFADPKGAALATQMVLVEDFLPERIDFDLSLPDAPLRITDTPPLTVDVSYLFGAPGAGLRTEGEVLLRAASGIDGFTGYSFGRHDEPFDALVDVLPSVTTDAQGRAVMAVSFPDASVTRPMEARLTVRVAEGSGRPVERRLTVPLAVEAPLIGIRPLFDGVLPEGVEAGFDVIAVQGSAQVPMRVKWSVNRVNRRYQWYSSYGNWNWEPVTTRTRIASGEGSIGDAPLQVSAPTEWGRYELVVERLDGAYTASSVGFSAGWYGATGSSDTPDVLEVSLDKPRYAPGETATVRLVPRTAGKALVSVMSNRVIDMKLVDVTEGENIVTLEVTDDWGAGAYVTASVIRPMDAAAGRNPARALGLSYAAVATPDQKLSVNFETATEARPRAPMDVALRVDGVQAGETAFVTLAAVDVGILNLTGFRAPDPTAHYFGQRKLGVELRDIYGRLIDGMQGAMGQVRSGGDAMAEMRMENPPPTEELVAYFSGPLPVGADGMVRTTFDLPAFNGTVRVMAVAWSPSGVGQAETDILVRDPVVVTASLPRFMAPGDSSRMLLEIVHATGPAGEMALAVRGDVAEEVQTGFALEPLGKQVVTVPLRATRIGLSTVEIVLTTPDGKRLVKTVTLPVQRNDPEVSRSSRFDLAAGDTFTLSRDVFTGLIEGSGTATLALGPLGRFNAPGLLASLDRYPYGCTEQTTSRALPLLYFDQVAEAMGLRERSTIRTRVDEAITRVLSRQSSSGGFGLWRAESGDFWLDAYVTDFLSRAKAQGFEVPDQAFTQAIENLRSRVNYAPDFDAQSNRGGQDVAYALMVLAREGQAAMGDLRYFVDVKADAFATPLAAAQLGAAMAMYGDQVRADRMFARAGVLMAGVMGEEAGAPVWRSDYGTNLRDAAAVLTLAVEAGSTALDTGILAQQVTQPRERTLSTQESTWSLLAAHALISATGQSGFTVNGATVDGPLVPVLEDDIAAQPIAVTNGSARAEIVTLTTFGVPDIPMPSGGVGYTIQRAYYTTKGAPVDPAQVVVGTRLVTVLTVTPWAQSEARLMVNDPLPAGFEIDNPSLLRSGDIRELAWLQPASTRMAEFRQDRFLAALDWRSDKPFQLAYVVRAISAGEYHHPASLVEDMYRPQFRAWTDAGRVRVVE